MSEEGHLYAVFEAGIHCALIPVHFVENRTNNVQLHIDELSLNCDHPYNCGQFLVKYFSCNYTTFDVWVLRVSTHMTFSAAHKKVTSQLR